MVLKSVKSNTQHCAGAKDIPYILAY